MGIGVFFVTQNPTDLPDSALAQLGNRVQHALRAFTPKDRKALETRPRPFPSPGTTTSAGPFRGSARGRR